MKCILQLSHARMAHGDAMILDDITLAFLPVAKVGAVSVA